MNTTPSCPLPTSQIPTLRKKISEYFTLSAPTRKVTNDTFYFFNTLQKNNSCLCNRTLHCPIPSEVKTPQDATCLLALYIKTLQPTASHLSLKNPPSPESTTPESQTLKTLANIFKELLEANSSSPSPQILYLAENGLTSPLFEKAQEQLLTLPKTHSPFPQAFPLYLISPLLILLFAYIISKQTSP